MAAQRLDYGGGTRRIGDIGGKRIERQARQMRGQPQFATRARNGVRRRGRERLASKQCE
jgi:hypothetical protein